MAHPHGIVHQNEPVVGISLAALAANGSVVVGNTFDGITATFLMIRMRYMLQIEGITVDEGPIGAILAPGNASAGEIQNAINNQNTSGPQDETQMIGQAEQRSAIHDTMRMFKLYDGGTRGQLHTGWIKLAKRGIPFAEGSGWVVHVYNADSVALTSGALVKGIIQYQGVWLRD